MDTEFQTISFEYVNISKVAYVNGTKTSEVTANNVTFVNGTWYVNGTEVIYVDEPSYTYSTEDSINLFNNSPNFEMNISLSEYTFSRLMHFENLELYPYFPLEASGRLYVYDGDDLFTSYVIEDWRDSFWQYIFFRAFELDPGLHTITFRYCDDYDYFTCPDEIFNLTVTPIIFNVPDVVILDGETSTWLGYGVSEDKYVRIRSIVDFNEGIVTMLVDGDVHYNSTYRHDDINLESLSCGLHDYEIRYWGSQNYPEFVKSGILNVTYLFKTEIKQKLNSSDLLIYIPKDATGNVSFTLNGKKYIKELPSKYTGVYIDGVYMTYRTIEIDELDVGVYELNITYSGDDKYPENTFVFNMTVGPTISLSSSTVYYNETIIAFLRVLSII